MTSFMGAQSDKALFCPGCGSASIRSSALGGDAACEICDWKGSSSELAAFHFTHDLGSPEQVFHAFFLDVRAMFAKGFAIEAAHLLVKWGFLEELSVKSSKLLARYIAAAARGMVVAIIDERKALEKEKAREHA